MRVQRWKPGVVIILMVTIKQFNIQPHLESLCQGLDELGLSLSEEVMEQIFAHLQIMQKWNQRLNLTAVTQTEDMINYHVLDSLVIEPFIKGSRVLDIGTGGGFPGIPLALANPDRQYTLLDSRGKRIEFLRFVKGKLGLDQVELVNNRVENYQPLEKFDTLVTRAFSSVGQLLQLTSHLSGPGTRVLAMKGRYPESELEQLPELTKSRMTIEKLNVPGLGQDRHLIIIDF